MQIVIAKTQEQAKRIIEHYRELTLAQLESAWTFVKLEDHEHQLICKSIDSGGEPFLDYVKSLISSNVVFDRRAEGDILFVLGPVAIELNGDDYVLLRDVQGKSGVSNLTDPPLKTQHSHPHIQSDTPAVQLVKEIQRAIVPTEQLETAVLDLIVKEDLFFSHAREIIYTYDHRIVEEGEEYVVIECRLGSRRESWRLNMPTYQYRLKKDELGNFHSPD